MTETNGYQLDLDCEFGGLSIGDGTARLGFTVARERLELEEADHYLCGKRLAGAVTLQAREDEAQERLPGMEDAEPPTVEAVFDVKQVGVKPKAFSAGLTFSTESVDVAELAQFAKRSGRLLVETVGPIDDPEPGDPDDPTEGERDAPEPPEEG